MSNDTTDEFDIDYVANLARIELTEDEKKTFGAQLGDILAYFDKLKAVDVSGIEATAHSHPVVNVWAEDKPGPVFTPAEALRNAPAQKDDHVVVPRIVDE